MHTPRGQNAAAAAEGQSLAQALAMAGVVIGRVLNGQSLNRAMSELKATGRMRAAVQSLTYSTLRDYGVCDALLGSLTQRPPANSLRGLLMAAITELEHAHQGSHAIVHQAVEAAARLAPRNAPGAKGLVNGVLRNYLRQAAQLRAQVRAVEPGLHRLPPWWLARLMADWPADWEGIVAAGDAMPSMCLRVNRRRSNAQAYMEKLQAAGISGRVLGQQAILLDRPLPVEQLPGFSLGEVSVQDWGAQQAAELLGVADGDRVLDACAAPGGKTAHLAESGHCELVAMDVDAQRLARVRDNLQRLGLAARVLVGDVLHPDPALGLFDRILADVPCSASGVLRRHPDVRWLRRNADIDAFARTQQAMLRALWSRLKPGGRLLYVTCSVFRQENELQVEAFLAAQADARRLALAGDGLSWAAPGQLLPGPQHDGFFYALLGKAG